MSTAPVVALAGVLVRSISAERTHSLAIGCDGRVYSWGQNGYRELGHGDTFDRLAPALVEGLEGVRAIAAAVDYSLAVTQSGDVFSWGRSLLRTEDDGERKMKR
jgi:alpha-tubulin suppressor-like RCC1 family protein